MSIATRKVASKKDHRGVKTGRTGIVYDVSFKYKTLDGLKTYNKKGFLSKSEAREHEAEMISKLTLPIYANSFSENGRKKLSVFLLEWIDTYGEENLSDNSKVGYRNNIVNHINPYLGSVILRELTPFAIDFMIESLLANGLAVNTVKYVLRTLSSALESAVSYQWIPSNPAKNITNKLKPNGKERKPVMYTLSDLAKLLLASMGTPWEMKVAMAILYGTRLSENLGLRTYNVHLKSKYILICEQLPIKLESPILSDTLAPLKALAKPRMLPITDLAQIFLVRQKNKNNKVRETRLKLGKPYYDNDLLIPKEDGSPFGRSSVSSKFRGFVQRAELPELCYHDLRHNAASIMYNLTGDFFAVAAILGHTLKGLNKKLDMGMDFDPATVTYVHVDTSRKLNCVQTYHNALYQELERLSPHIFLQDLIASV